MIACPECNGDKEIFEGAAMRPNPASYADYDEIWATCKRCKGKGTVDSLTEDETAWIKECERLEAEIQSLVKDYEGGIPF